jgi:acetoin utilization protein AcuC
VGGNSGFVYSEDFMKYDFGPTHPLRPVRLKLTFDLLKETGVLDNSSVSIHLPRQATEDELLMVHTKEYIEEVKSFSKTGVGYLDSGDTPAFKGIHEATSVAVGGSIVAAELVTKGKVLHAFNPAGGLHHAGISHAAGFCVYNDIGVAVRHLQRKCGVKKVAIVDLDVHHGDGTQEIFYADQNVLAIDFHESGKYLYPGRGFTSESGEGEARGYKVNVPLPPLTGNDCYLHAFDELVPPLLRAFKPEVIINQFGVDTHFDDPLAHLRLTMKAYGALASRMHSIAHEVCGGKYIILGGGGYNPQNVARAWTIMFSTVTEIKIPNDIPQQWINFCRQTLKREPPRTLSDDRDQSINSVEREKIAEEIEQVITEIKTRIFQIHGIKS